MKSYQVVSFPLVAALFTLIASSARISAAETVGAQTPDLSDDITSYVRQLEELESTYSGINDRFRSDNIRGHLESINAILNALQKRDLPNRIAALNALLRSHNPATRARASRALGLLRAESAVGSLVELLVSDDHSRQAAGTALAAIGAPAASALIQLLQHEDPDVVLAAAECLGEMEPDKLRPDSKIIEALIATMYSKNTKVCNAAITSLGSFKNPRAVGAIIKSLQDAGIVVEPDVAATALVRVGELSVAPLIAAIKKCHSKADADFARWAAAALGDVGSSESISALYTIATSKWALPSDTDARDSPPPGSQMEVPEWKYLEHWWGHYEAVKSLDSLLSLDFAPLHADLAPKVDACAQATYALGMIGKRALPALVDLTSGPTAWRRSRAIEGLYLLNRKEPITEPEAVLALVSRLKDEDKSVRKTSLRTLKAITKATTANEAFFNFVYGNIDNGRASNAVAMAIGYQAFVEENIVQVFAFGSEQQRLAYATTIQDLWHPYCMLVGVASSESLAKAVLHLKGIVLDSLTEDSQAAPGRAARSVKTSADQSGTPEAAGRSSEATFQVSNRGKSRERAIPPGTQLAARSGETSKARRAFVTSISDVQAALAQEGVLLEYIRYPHYLGAGKFELRYGVLVIGNSKVTIEDAKPGEPVWVPLGSAEAVERNLKEYDTVMRGEKRGEVSLLRTLYTQLFEPIQKRLPKGITTLVISPDAELNFMSFATLVNAQDRFLAEQYTIKYVASGRDLVFGRAGKKGSRRLAAFANPAFGEKPAVASASDTNIVHLAMMTADQRDYAGVALAALPNTLQEAEFLRERCSAWNMQGVMYAGAEATEAEVKAVKSPYILHLATHGFFLPDTLPTNQPTMDTRLLGQERMPVVLHNPMQRSGLAFAGAQLTLDAWKRGETPDPENDGILMAQEVGTMDLKETWLVVLSACDTGVGEARAGEGVLGLRRGFIQAGAQNLLMTLWPVSDKWTVEMMKAFYERALKDGDAPGALAQVQREYLGKLRKEKNAVLAARLAGPFILTFQGKTPK